MITRICWWLVDALSQRLEPDEREAVRGDLAESGWTGSRALAEVFGLLVRRQAAMWNNWQPLLALIVLVGPVSLLLGLGCNWVNGSYDLRLWMIRNYRDIDPTGLLVRQSIADLSRISLLLFCWSWAIGFVLGAMSRRTIWINGTLFCVASLFWAFAYQMPFPYMYGVRGWPLPLWFYTGILPLILQAILILLPSLGGMYQGLQPPTRLRQTILWGVAIAIALLVRGSFKWSVQGGWEMQLLLLAAYWPIGYLAVSAIGRGWQHRIGSNL
jgi:hypothetical protein